MPKVTVNVPSVGLEAYFSFKEPINRYLKNKFNLDAMTTKLKVVSIISMKDSIKNDLRDPYSELYNPAGISESDYKKDLTDNVYIVSFYFKDVRGVEQTFRSPLSYIESISTPADIEYMNRLIVLDLNQLPVGLDLSSLFNDLADFVKTRTGVEPDLKEVSIGDVSLISPTEHETRETVRANMVTVHKTLSIQLEEADLKHDQLLQRLQTLGITLG